MTITEPGVKPGQPTPELQAMAAELIKDALRLQMDAQSLAERAWALEHYRTAVLPSGEGVSATEEDDMLRRSSELLGIDVLWDIAGAAAGAVASYTGSLHDPLDRAAVTTLFSEAGKALDRLEGR